MSEVTETISEQIEHAGESTLNTRIALIVAISASLMAIFNIKANNIVQAMAQEQAHVIDSWSYFQAKSTKQSMTENQINMIELQMLREKNIGPVLKAKLNALLDQNRKKVSRYEQEKNEIKLQAENHQKTYEELNVYDDQFDLAEALITLGLTIFGITALTRRKPLFYFGLLFSFGGVVFGFAGFAKIVIHPEWLTSILG